MTRLTRFTRLTLFDLDGTLLPIDSDHAFGEFMVRLGWADAAQHRHQNDVFFQQYQAGKLDINAYVDFATAPWRNQPLAQIEAANAQFVAEVAKAAIRDTALALVQQHQQAGDCVAIVTATNDFITRPIAQLLGVRDLIATELARNGAGRVTGAILGTPSFREGKITRVQQWLASLGHQWQDFERICFYSDSTNDLPLLEAVSHPIATNPSPELERIALARGWPITRLFA
jgi:HAD superfamily hydrolase (TIGR01490 family)